MSDTPNRPPAANPLGISQQGLKAALEIKQAYREKEPLLVPGEADRLLEPEFLINHDLDLQSLEDPLALAMMSVRDPEAPMALAAAARLAPLGKRTTLLAGITQVVGEAAKHDIVSECLKYVTDRAFDPNSIAKVRRHTSKIIIETRQQYTAALKENLRSLLDGAIAPRAFVKEFFELTEAGNMRHDVRQKLLSSLLLADTIRPSIKFLMLENFDRMPKPVRLGIISEILRAPPSHHTDMIREELKYIVTHETLFHGRPDDDPMAALDDLDAAPLGDFPIPTPFR